MLKILYDTVFQNFPQRLYALGVPRLHKLPRTYLAARGEFSVREWRHRERKGPRKRLNLPIYPCASERSRVEKETPGYKAD